MGDKPYMDIDALNALQEQETGRVEKQEILFERVDKMDVLADLLGISEELAEKHFKENLQIFFSLPSSLSSFDADVLGMKKAKKAIKKSIEGLANISDSTRFLIETEKDVELNQLERIATALSEQIEEVANTVTCQPTTGLTTHQKAND